MNILASIGKFLLDTLQSILLAASVLFILYLFVVQPYQVKGSSMDPALTDGQVILCNLLDVRFHNLKRGDIIVFKSPVEEMKHYVKRVIALPDETVRIDGGRVYVNEEPLNESSYLSPEMMTYGGQFMEEGKTMTVPEGTYFVLGDNRSDSSDSRDFGFLREDSIIGKAFFRVWPASDISSIVNPFVGK